MAENSFKKRLTEDGFVLIPNILDGKQIISLRSSLNNIYEKGPRYEGDTKKVRFDLLGRYSELNWLLFHEPLLKALRNLLGEDFIFLKEMSAHLSGYGNWHKDTTAQEVAGHTFHFDKDFLIIQAALYLQDNTKEYGGGLDVIKGSHKMSDDYVKSRISPNGFIKSFFWKLKNKIKTFFKKQAFFKKYRKNIHEKVSHTIPSKAGDLVIFDYRLDHKASWPQREVPYETPKMAIFFSASKNNLHAENHMKFLETRKEYMYLKNHKYQENLIDRAKKNKVNMWF